MDPSILIIIAMFAVLYLFLLRPQQKRERERQALVRSLTDGDEVITNAGIHGVVVEVEKDVVWLEVAPNVELKIIRDAVARRAQQESGESESDEDATSDQEPGSLSSMKKTAIDEEKS